MIEDWKDIEGYEGHYQISNLGNVKSLYHKNKCGIIYREKILKPVFNGKNYQISLCSGGNVKIYLIHRLVAKAFLGKSDLLVDHIDGNKLNNNINNLEYVTPRENTIRAYKSNLINIPKGKNNYNYGKPSKKRKRIGQYDDNENLIKVWDYADMITKELNINASNIRSCCRNKRNKAGGFVWKYIN